MCGFPSGTGRQTDFIGGFKCRNTDRGAEKGRRGEDRGESLGEYRICGKILSLG